MKFFVEAIGCEHCVTAITTAFKEKNVTVNVDIPTKIVTVNDNNGLTQEQLLEVLASCDYDGKVL